MSGLLLRELRALFARYGLVPPPRPADGSAQGHAEAMAGALLGTLARRRTLDATPLSEALGRCVRLAPRTAPLATLRRLSLLVFASAGYRPEEAAALLRGRAGCLARTRGGAPAAALYPRFGSRAELCEAEAAARLADRCEAAEASPRDAAALHGCLLEALTTLRAHAAVPAPPPAPPPLHAVAAAALARVVCAGCAQLRREKRHAESVEALRVLLRGARTPHPRSPMPLHPHTARATPPNPLPPPPTPRGVPSQRRVCRTKRVPPHGWASPRASPRTSATSVRRCSVAKRRTAPSDG